MLNEQDYSLVSYCLKDYLSPLDYVNFMLAVAPSKEINSLYVKGVDFNIANEININERNLLKYVSIYYLIMILLHSGNGDDDSVKISTVCSMCHRIINMPFTSPCNNLNTLVHSYSRYFKTEYKCSNKICVLNSIICNIGNKIIISKLSYLLKINIISMFPLNTQCECTYSMVLKTATRTGIPYKGENFAYHYNKEHGRIFKESYFREEFLPDLIISAVVIPITCVIHTEVLKMDSYHLKNGFSYISTYNSLLIFPILFENYALYFILLHENIVKYECALRKESLHYLWKPVYFAWKQYKKISNRFAPESKTKKYKDNNEFIKLHNIHRDNKISKFSIIASILTTATIQYAVFRHLKRS